LAEARDEKSRKWFVDFLGWEKKGPLVISGTLLMLHQEEHTELSLHKFASSTREIFVSYDSAI